MKVFHDSRSREYRAPYGAVTPGTAVTLAVDVSGASGASAMLRTWLDGEGERLYQMKKVESACLDSALSGETAPFDKVASSDEAAPSGNAEPSDGTDATPEAAPSGEAGVERFQVQLKPEVAGIVWYHFIVTDENGNAKRYGAEPGRVGGTGQLYDWEPPSFQLTVHEPRDMPPAWHETVGAYLYNPQAVHTLREIVETVRENFPASTYRSAYPWNEKTLGQAPDWSPWPALAASPDAGESETSNAAGGAGEHASFPLFAVNDEVFGFWSRDDAANWICTLVNTSTKNMHDVAVPLVSDEVSELVGGYGVRVIGASELRALRRTEHFNFDDVPSGADHAGGDTTGDFARFAHAHLNPTGTCVLLFHATLRMQRPLDPGLGVLAHITSLPADGMGTLGAPAREFVDQIARAGARYWQVLPVSPTDECGSPYAGISAFAGNVRLLEGAEGAFTDPSPIPRADGRTGRSKGYREFCEREGAWLEPYAAFMAIRQKLGDDLPWQEWPKKYRRYDAGLIARDEELAAFAEAWRQAQYRFERQWSDLRAHANANGVLIVGDMPIYVSADSADAWAHPDIFQLDGDGLPVAVAGCAPDSFAPEGQIWGNPLYDWDACRAEGYDWWLRRLKRAFELYDIVRLDHFIGFSRYYSIPAGGKGAEGSYRPGPGIELFQRAFEKLGPLPVIAEDLGLITPAVRDLGEGCGFPGMDIAQFVDGNDPLSGYTPRPGKVAYTGTHDNQTLAGYCRERYPRLDARQAAADIMEKVAACPADVRIVPLQDLMGLGDEARMNTPGTTEGNWMWQADAADMPAALEQLRKLASLNPER